MRSAIIAEDALDGVQVQSRCPSAVLTGSCRGICRPEESFSGRTIPASRAALDVIAATSPSIAGKPMGGGTSQSAAVRVSVWEYELRRAGKRAASGQVTTTGSCGRRRIVGTACQVACVRASNPRQARTSNKSLLLLPAVVGPLSVYALYTPGKHEIHHKLPEAGRG